jgi:hypothetical protein
LVDLAALGLELEVLGSGREGGRREVTEMVAGAMMSVRSVSLRCVGEPGSLFAQSNSCAGKVRLPAPSRVGLSSRAALSGASECGFLARGGGRVGVGVKSAAMGVTSAAVTSTVDLNARRPEVETAIDEAMSNCITESHLNDTIPSLGPKIRGKVTKFSETIPHIFLLASFAISLNCSLLFKHFPESTFFLDT